MKFINFAIVKFSISLVLGILTAHFFPLDFSVFKYLISAYCILLVLFLLIKKQLSPSIYFGISCYLCFFLLGYFNYQIRLPQFHPRHFVYQAHQDRPDLLFLKVERYVKPDLYNQKFIASVKRVNHKLTTGKILMLVPHDSLLNDIKVDDLLLVYSTIQKLPSAKNPSDFDYSSFMNLQDVYGQSFINNHSIISKKEGSKTIFGTAQNIRSDIVAKLSDTKLGIEERGIIQALILGEKKDVNPDLYKKYAAAGAVHILAVSGLHVGILYSLLLLLLHPLRYIQNGIQFQYVLIILILWLFAFLSGLSPSVTRAVTMFSVFAFAQIIYRKTSSLNNLFLSFFFLLIYNPLWLFQVGFQLSYLAVFFIVWLNPYFEKLWRPKNFALRKIYAISTVSICAQLGVMPLTLYYFHQFPGLFLITNIIILPVLGVIMALGIIVVILAVLQNLPDWSAVFYNTIVRLMNDFISWVALQEQFLFTDIPFSSLKTLCSYIVIVLLVLWLKFAKHKLTVAFLLSVALLIMVFIYENFSNSHNEMYVFHRKGRTVLIRKSGRNMEVLADDGKVEEIFSVKSYKIKNAIKATDRKPLPKVFKYENKNILILDSLGIVPAIDNVHTIILRKNPRVNFERLIDSTKPQHIIADGSNTKYFVERWSRTCKKKKLPFHNTAEKGAYAIR